MPSYFKVFPQTMGLFRGSRGDPADHIFDNDHDAPGRWPARSTSRSSSGRSDDLDIEEFFRDFEFTAVWLPEGDTNGDLHAAPLARRPDRVGRYPEPDDRPEGMETASYSGIFGPTPTRR